MIDYLADCGADLDARCNVRDFCPKLSATHPGRQAGEAEYACQECAAVTVRKRGECESGSQLGSTALHIAAESGHADAIRTLLLRGAGKDSRGDVSLQCHGDAARAARFGFPASGRMKRVRPPLAPLPSPPRQSPSPGCFAAGRLVTQVRIAFCDALSAAGWSLRPPQRFLGGSCRGRQCTARQWLKRRRSDQGMRGIRRPALPRRWANRLPGDSLGRQPTRARPVSLPGPRQMAAEPPPAVWPHRTSLRCRRRLHAHRGAPAPARC